MAESFLVTCLVESFLVTVEPLRPHHLFRCSADRGDDLIRGIDSFASYTQRLDDVGVADSNRNLSQ